MRIVYAENEVIPMIMIIAISYLAASSIMLIINQIFQKIRWYYHFFAVISFYVAGVITADAVYTVLQEHTVYTMNIHGILLNPFFLITGSYLGVYFLYLLLFELRKNTGK